MVEVLLLVKFDEGESQIDSSVVTSLRVQGISCISCADQSPIEACMPACMSLCTSKPDAPIIKDVHFVYHISETFP
jgi:hypothetical protein